MPEAKKKKPSTISSASFAGFHFYNLYQCCPRKFYFKTVLKVDGKKKSAALLSGSAFHSGKQTYYNTWSRKKGVAKVVAEIEKARDIYESEDLYKDALFRFPILLDNWIDQYGAVDKKRWNILGVEQEINLPIPGTCDPKGNPFQATMRLDLLVSEKADKKTIYVVDTKTSSMSWNTAAATMRLSDQATMYLWGAEKLLGRKPFGLIVDIAYWNSKSRSETNIQCLRTDIIYRTQKAIEEFLQGLAGIINEASQKVAALKRGFPPAELFPRNSHFCTSYFKPCEFADYCQPISLSSKGRLPAEFRRTGGISSILKPILDQLSNQLL